VGGLVRHHFGISSFGVNAWTARNAGDRIINEHDESEPDTTLLALGGTPGKAYEPDGWELWAPLNPLYQAGAYAEAADRGRQLVEAHPQYAGLFYNLACCESLAGRTTDALDHLGRAIDRSERFRSYARDDSDFDPLRDEPAFKALIERVG
jgi:tetratricopeptide (TPR) repeat protein